MGTNSGFHPVGGGGGGTGGKLPPLKTLILIQSRAC